MYVLTMTIPNGAAQTGAFPSAQDVKEHLAETFARLAEGDPDYAGLIEVVGSIETPLLTAVEIFNDYWDDETQAEPTRAIIERAGRD